MHDLMRRIRARVPSQVAIIAAGLGAIAASAWLHVESARGAQQNVDNDVVACIGADAVLRAPELESCPGGTRRIELSGADLKRLDARGKDDSPDPGAQGFESKSSAIDAIERRIGNLEAGGLFEVVDKAGRVMFRASRGEVRLFTRSQLPVAGMSASEEGGRFGSVSADGKAAGVVGLSRAGAVLRVYEGNVLRVSLGKQDAGNYALKFPLGDRALAGIGESKAGSGALVLADSSGQPRTELQVSPNAQGAADIYSASGATVASLGGSVNGGGMLVLTDASSTSMVLMKSNDNRYGAVLAFPPGLPYIPASGLPGSYLLGCAGGEKCIPMK